MRVLNSYKVELHGYNQWKQRRRCGNDDYSVS